MTARKINRSTNCPLHGTPRTALRELLEDYRSVRIRLRGKTEGPEYRIRIRVQSKERSEGDRY
jgi:hypothetical protein